MTFGSTMPKRRQAAVLRVAVRVRGRPTASEASGQLVANSKMGEHIQNISLEACPGKGMGCSCILPCTFCPSFRWEIAGNMSPELARAQACHHGFTLMVLMVSLLRKLNGLTQRFDYPPMTTRLSTEGRIIDPTVCPPTPQSQCCRWERALD